MLGFGGDRTELLDWQEARRRGLRGDPRWRQRRFSRPDDAEHLLRSLLYAPDSAGDSFRARLLALTGQRGTTGNAALARSASFSLASGRVELWSYREPLPSGSVTAPAAEPAPPVEKGPARQTAARPSEGPFLAKKLGEREPGAVPMTPALEKKIANSKRQGPRTEEGWPDLPADKAATFEGAAEPVNLPPGTKIYRVIGSSRDAGGSYWSLEQPPQTEAEWRAGAAVLNDWNGDGGYVEYTVPEGGLRGWQGPAAPQPTSALGYALSGGDQQLWIPRGTATPSGGAKPTPWNTTVN